MSDSESDQKGIPLFEPFSDPDSPQPPESAKRKRHVDSTVEIKKSVKRRKQKKPKDIEDESLDSGLGVNHAFAHMDSRLLADHIAQRTKRFRPDLSILEIEESYVPVKAIVDTTSWETPRTTENLPMYIEQFAGPRRKKKGHKLVDVPHEKGHPHTLVVAAAGLRAADLTRALRKFQTKEALVAKLFAKHIKMREAIEMVKKSRMNIAVGTPQRIFDLLENGALSSTHLERIVIDASHIDQKKRGILDMKETQVPLVELLSRAELKERYGGSEGLELLFF